MTVADEQRLDGRQVLTETAGVGQQGLALAGVEQIIAQRRFEIAGKAVLAEQTEGPCHGIFTENR